MGNILYTKNGENGRAFNYFSGTVSSVREPASPDKPFHITIRMALMNPETKKTDYKPVSMSAWNSEKMARADRYSHMKIKKGSYVFGMCGDLREQTVGKKTYINTNLFFLSYSGRLDIEDGGKKYVMLSGHVGNVNDGDDGKSVSFGLAVDGYDREKGESTTNWFNVECAGNVFQRISKSARLEKGVSVTILGQIKEPGTDTKNPVVTCYRFDFADAPKSK